MFCTTVIPTIGRATLGRAVESVLEQSLPGASFEVIVVNDSGQPLRAASWQRSDRVRVVDTNRRNRCVARNTGAGMARGAYLHFLDDDDWMLPGAFGCFWQLANDDPAAWLYGAFRLVDSSGELIGEILPDEIGNCLLPLLAWEWLPIQASMIKAEAFFAVGGFDPAPFFSRIFQDVDLSRQIALIYKMAQVHKPVCCIRAGDEGSTTSYADMFVANRHSREKVLGTPGVLGRLRESAAATDNMAYWHGRIVYYYFASVKWNMSRNRLAPSVSRACHALASAALSGPAILSPHFWRALAGPHHNKTRRLLEREGVAVYENTNWIN